MSTTFVPDCRFNYTHVILKKTWNWSARSKEAIILRWAPSWIFTVKNWAERYCVRKYPDLAPSSLKCHTSPSLNPSGISSPRPPRVRRWRRVTIQTDRPHDSGFITYLKISSLESGFRKLRIRLPDLPNTCERKPDPQRKSCGFKNIGIRVDGGLISKIVVSSSDRREFTHRESHIPLAWLSVHSYAECHDLLERCAIPLALIPKIWTKDFFFFFLRWFECISYSWQREGVLRFSVVFEVRDH